MPTPTLELPGFHAVKHAMRFGAEDLRVWTDAPARALDLAQRSAPDVVEPLRAVLTEVDRAAFDRLGEPPHHTRVHGRATHPAWTDRSFAARPHHPVVHLERPTDAGNVGAAIRVAAALGAAGVLVEGFAGTWTPACVRGSAGLHLAVPVVDGGAEALERPIVALDPSGSPFDPVAVDAASVLAFGAEREGLTPGLLERADRVMRLPMTPGVSSLNLATAVAAAGYAIALREPGLGR